MPIIEDNSKDGKVWRKDGREILKTVISSGFLKGGGDWITSIETRSNNLIRYPTNFNPCSNPISFYEFHN